MELNKNNQKTHDDLKKVGDAVPKTASHAKENAEGFIDEAKEKGSDMVDKAKKQAAELQEGVIGYVKAHPLAAVGYAALAGFLVAMLVHSK